MKRLLMLLLVLALLIMPVSAMEFTAPSAPSDVQELMPAETESFAEGLWYVVKSSVAKYAPDLTAAALSCLALVAAVLLASLLNAMPGSSKRVNHFVCTLAICTILLGQANSLVNLCAKTVNEISEYGKLLLPTMTAALAAEGGTTSATALYAGTAIFDTVLCTVISKLLVPMVYVFMALAAANGATGEEILKKIRDFAKWLMTWSLKTILYIFTGYMSITGVITGTADAAAVKAAKLTISGVVPVVGGILSDASETVILGAGVMKNAVGVYGLLAILAICVTPFLQIGVQYLLLKWTAVLCSVFGVKTASDLIEDFSSAMGILLGMVGTVSFLMLVSMICFMKGMG